MNNKIRMIIGVIFSFLIVFSAMQGYNVFADENYCSADNLGDFFAQRIEFNYVGMSNNMYHFKLKLNPISGKNTCEKMLYDGEKVPVSFEIVQGAIPAYDEDGNEVIDPESGEKKYDTAASTIYDRENLPLLKCGKEIDIYATNLDVDPNGGSLAFVIGLRLSPTDDKKGNVLGTGGCIVKGKTIDFLATGLSDENYEDVSFPVVGNNNGDISVGKQIKCDKEYPENSFEAKFCYAKKNANKSYNFSNGSYDKDTPETFSCSFNPNDIVLPSVANNNLQGDSYFYNKNYLFGSASRSLATNYVYHYAPGRTKTVEAKCSLTCEEAVDVEYGLPVASKAGLCFEYKVRVTSRVSCYSNGNIPKPLGTAKYCTPSPVCKSLAGKVYDQGGPNDEYDACIQSCDGGKYTKKCSNKCYVDIYGSIAAGAKAKFVYSGNHKLVNGADIEKYYPNDNACWGYYSVNGGNFWNSAFGGTYFSAGRWYCENSQDSPRVWKPPTGNSPRSLFDVSENDGFFRRRYGVSHCTDKCTWTGCNGTYTVDDVTYQYYLNKYVPCSTVNATSSNSKYCGSKNNNQGRTYTFGNNKVDYVDIAKYDYERNMAEYDKLVDSCNAQAVCSTTTSYYTISATYGEKGVSTKTTVDFPGNSKDHAGTSGNSSDNTADQVGTTLFINYPGTNLGLSGCYNLDHTLHAGHTTDLYRTTWGFPGTWVNIKTGEVSYSGNGINHDSAWRLYNDKFCLPNNARDVNIEWYDAYRAKELMIPVGTYWDNVTGPSVMNQDIIDECYTYTFIDKHVPDFPVPKVDYNIIAHAIDFGYFNWDIDIKCFYALFSTPFTSTSHTENEELSKNCDTSPDNRRVHAVDPVNLFPSPDGSQNTSVSKPGRLPGFNWSEYAVLKDYKNKEYVSDPPKLMEKIQTIALAGNTYSDTYLDYQFYLTPANIRNIRRSNKAPLNNGNYSSDNGAGVIHYNSEFIRNSSYFTNIKTPQANLVYCNNIEGSSCWDFKEVK